MQLTDAEFKTKLLNKHGDKIVAKEAYKGMRKTINFHCNECGFEWESTPLAVLRAKRCPQCTSQWRKTARLQTKDEMQAKINHIWQSDEYILHDDYTKSTDPVTITHKTCGRTYIGYANNLVSHHGCLACAGQQSESQGEQIIYNILKQNDIEFEYQKKLEINEHLHFFDFYIPSKKLWVEYDGQQHTDKNHSWYSPDRKERDLEKNKFVAEKEETLLRIPYTHNNVHEIIKDIELVSQLQLKLTFNKNDKLTKPIHDKLTILSFYNTHTIQETMAKFKISRATLYRYRQRYSTIKTA